MNDWNGTNEIVSASGKNRLADLFFGSDDANLLCLTDDENGDGIFVDDEFTELPEGIEGQQSRIAQIDEHGCPPFPAGSLLLASHRGSFTHAG